MSAGVAAVATWARLSVAAVAVAPGVQLRAEEAGCRFEEVVPQRHDEQLRGQRLIGGPGRAGVLAAAALGTGQGVEQLLPAEILDVARAEDRVLVDVLHVGRAVERAEGTWASRRGDVDWRQHDMQVLRVGEEHQEPGDDGDVEGYENRLEHLV